MQITDGVKLAPTKNIVFLRNRPVVLHDFRWYLEVLNVRFERVHDRDFTSVPRSVKRSGYIYARTALPPATL
jgi:hypothetical protein